jgi:predicted DNA-binding transcriptional regulator YafY
MWYLVGHCRLRDDMRTFRVDRIQEIEPLDAPFSIPEDFSVADYLTRTMRYEQPYTVVVHLDATVADSVREWQGPWIEITERDDGAITATFGTASLDWAAGWVLSYGPAARALEPPELVARVRAAAEGVLGRYRRKAGTRINTD